MPEAKAAAGEPPDGSAPTVRGWASEWLPVIATQVKTSTYDSYRRIVELHVLPDLGELALDGITPRLLTTIYARLREPTVRRPNGLTPKTIRNIHVVVHKLLADAVESEVLTVNPADRAKVPRHSETPERELLFWQPAELAEFLRETREDQLGILWHVAAMTGMRRGELLGLQWHDVDLDGARLSVRRNLISISYRVLETTPKSNRARVVDLDTSTLERLRKQRAAHHTINLDDEHGRVFLWPNGSPIHPEQASDEFRKAILRAGVRPIRFHDLRHTHATIALRAGVPAKVISERLGHSTPEFTLAQYAHVIPGMQAEAAAQIAELVRAASPGDGGREDDDLSSTPKMSHTTRRVP